MTSDHKGQASAPEPVSVVPVPFAPSADYPEQVYPREGGYWVYTADMTGSAGCMAWAGRRAVSLRCSVDQQGASAEVTLSLTAAAARKLAAQLLGCALYVDGGC